VSDIELDLAAETITLFGVKYALEIFRALGFAPLGTVLEVIERERGTVTVKRYAPDAVRKLEALEKLGPNVTVMINGDKSA
jgi:hypothetical protein